MEPISLTVAGLGTVFYNSMFHFLVHIGGSTVIQKFQGYLNTVSIKNHDVDRAIHDSYRYVLGELQKECSREPENSKKTCREKFEKLVGFLRLMTKTANQPFKQEFEQLYSLVDELSHSIEKKTKPPEILISLPDLMTCEEPGTQLATMILDKAIISNEEFREFFIKSFPDLFLFAFKEIGLKNRPKVNIVLTNEVLCKIYNEVKEDHSELKAFNEDLLSVLTSEKERRMEFESNLKQKLSNIESGLLDIQSKIIKTDAYYGSFGVIRCFIVLWKTEKLIGVYPCNAPIITIGRELSKTIVLPDGDISRNHAQIYFREQGIVIRDSSLNGTKLNNVNLNKDEPTPINLGDTIEVSSYKIQMTLDLPTNVIDTFTFATV